MPIPARRHSPRLAPASPTAAQICATAAFRAPPAFLPPCIRACVPSCLFRSTIPRNWRSRPARPATTPITRNRPPVTEKPIAPDTQTGGVYTEYLATLGGIGRKEPHSRTFRRALAYGRPCAAAGSRKPEIFPALSAPPLTSARQAVYNTFIKWVKSRGGVLG